MVPRRPSAVLKKRVDASSSGKNRKKVDDLDAPPVVNDMDDLGMKACDEDSLEL